MISGHEIRRSPRKNKSISHEKPGTHQKRLQFNFKQMFNKQLWEDEVLRKYPQDQQLLNHFRKHILITGGVFISIILIVGITLSFILLK